MLMRSIPADLPGAELLRDGMADLHAGRESESSLVVEIAAPRLRTLGFDVPQHAAGVSGGHGTPEHRLYSLLAQRSDGGVHSYYNALLARVASFARAAEHASSR
jgi:hypothetical protein